MLRAPIARTGPEGLHSRPVLHKAQYIRNMALRGARDLMVLERLRAWHSVVGWLSGIDRTPHRELMRRYRR